ncbi:MAG: penicillin acylase family protein, partial [Solirubrobacterales bacterium]
PSAGFGWSSTTAYALTDANADNGGVINQYLAMGKARSVGQLLRIERRFRGTPFFNTVAADRKGVALYTDVGRFSNVPRSLIDACLPPGIATAVYQAARLITLDGSSSGCTPAGLLPADQMPQLARRDYVLNSNDSYWLANPSAPITGITPLIGLERTIQGLRTRSGNIMIQDKLRGGRRFKLRTLQRLFLSNRNHLAELVAGQLADVCQANPVVTISGGQMVNISEACPILRNYDRTGNLDSPGAWLFIEYARRSPAGFWADGFDPANPLTTPSQLNTGNPAHGIALGEAVQNMRNRGLPLASGLRGIQVATRGGRRISIHGCQNCFQNIGASDGSTAANAPYGEVIHGSSIVLAAELRKSGPRVRGFLTYSQATDPTSPWFANLTKRFSRKKWTELPFTRTQVRKAKRKRTKLPGTGR